MGSRREIRACQTCGQPFETMASGPARYCGQRCWQVERAKPGPCRDCGVEVGRKPGRGGIRRCDDCKARTRRAHYLHKNYQRRHAVPPPTVRIGIDELGDRDGWRCHLCRKQVNRKLKSPHPMSASMDHLIPASEAESSHEPVNLALAHRICNTRRSNRGPAQLALIG